MGENIIDATDATFDEAVVNSDIPTIVDFWAPWCGPCKQLTPILEDVAKDYVGKVNVAKVNIDNNRGVAAKFNIMAIPTLIVIRNGEVVNRAQGFSNRSGVADLFKQALG